MRTALIVLSVGLTAACASTTPTPELANARAAYDRARTSNAAQLAPASVLSAKQALDGAEAQHREHPQSDAERSASYVAERRAELAMVLASVAQERQRHQQADAAYGREQDTLRTQAEQERDATRQRAENLDSTLTNERKDSAAALLAKNQELQSEKNARKEAEERAARALQSLEKVAQVKEEARGVVITLSGQVLFLTGKAELLPSARDQLTQVAKAIKDQGDDRPISVEGYTDSRGSEELNNKLSQDRAEAVKSFLSEQGVPAQRLTAVGKGKANPVASNDSPEGRANNRRVEIVIGKR